jgi:uncharacterized protein YfaS (alpha-2-macroglobulin family)
MRLWLALWFALLCAFGAAACTSRNAQTAAPPAAVSPLPNPSLPPWIASISPTDTVDENAQVRIRFSEDVIPLESLASKDRAAALAAFSIDPPVPGRFVFYTPRLVGFEADAAPPLATRFRVTIRAGLADLKGDKLASDLAWTYTTTHIAVTDLPAQAKDADVPTVSLRPLVSLGSNVVLDTASLVDHTVLVPANGASPVPMVLVTPAPSPSPDATSADDASGERQPVAASYVLTPATDLAKATSYRVVVRAGVMPSGGNLPSDADATGRIRTYGPLTFTGVEPYGRPLDNNGVGRFEGGAPQLDFSNPLADGAISAVKVNPPPSPLAFYAPQGSTSIEVGSLALAPNTRYTLTVDPNLQDTFGQKLGGAASAQFTTTSLAADLWAPAGVTIFPSVSNFGINVVSTNLPSGARAAFRAVQPAELVYVDPNDSSAFGTDQSQSEPGPKLLPPFAQWRPLPVAQRRDRSTTTVIPIRQRLGGPTGMLAYGILADTNRYRNDGGQIVRAQPSFLGVVQLTNVGIFAQWFPHGGIVRTNHLSDGSPIAHAKVDVYESQLAAKQWPQPEPCASGTTDANGLLQLNGVGFSRCAATAASATDAPELFVVAHDRNDWAYVRTFSWSGGYDDGLNGGWSAGQPDARGALISDRSLYQPGETAYFTGVAYFLTDGVLGRGKASSYTLTLQSPSGKVTPLGNRSGDVYGTFPLTVRLARDQELGYYTVHAQAAGGEELFGYFRVAQFKPPNFNVTLSLGSAYGVEGSTVRASAVSKYLFGAPVAGAGAQVNVTRQRTYFTPTGWDGWDYGRSWFYPEEEPSVPSDVLQKNAKLDDAGAYALDIPVGADLPYPMSYEVDFQTTDVANVAVSDSKTFTALPSDALILLNGDFVARAGAAFTLKAAVTDPGGKAIAGRRVHLVLQRRKFAEATQELEGGEAPKDAVTYETVAQADVTSAGGAQGVTLTAPDAGSYRVRANFADRANDTTATDHDLWITGPGEVDWGGTSRNHLVMKLDKKTYRVGETATALVVSPYDDAELDFAVVRGGVLYASHQIVKGSAPQIKFTVTQAMLPNAAIEGVLIRRGPSLAHGVPRSLDQLARIGFAAFTTNLDGKTLKIGIVPAQPSPAPGASQTVRLHLKDGQGRPVRGQLAVMVVNEAVLQLTGYRPPDLVQMVYAEQPISTRWADSRSDVSLAEPQRPEEKGFGFGGGFLEGAGDTRVRTNFQPVSYYNGALKTDASGNASVTFTLPDDLTTWRVMALAFTTDARFGNADTTFLTTKPLIANPVMPQFARPGDTMNAGVSVTNTAKAGGTLAIDGVLGGGLAFVENGKQVATASLSEPVDQLTKAYRFPMIVTSAVDGTMKFGARLGGASDAFEVPLAVRTNAVMESVVTTGATKDAAQVPLDVAAGTPTDAGGLDISLASTLLPDMVEPVRASLRDDDAYGVAVASRIDVAADGILIAKRYRQTPPAQLADALAKDVASLRGLRAADGGVGEWPGAKDSAPYLSAFTATALAHASSAGSADAARALAALRPALLRMLANPTQLYSGCADDLCRADIRLNVLAALAENGEVRSDFIGQIYAQRDAFDTTTRIVLARQLARLGPWSEQAKQLREKISQNVYETGRTASLSDFDSPVSAQAQLVSLYAQTRQPLDQIDRVLQSLLNLRKDGLWGCSCANAVALDAIVAYAALQPTPPAFTANATVGTAPPRAAVFNGYAKTSADLNYPMAGVPRGRSTVALQKTGNGTLHYVVAYRYRVAGDAPGRYQGLRIDRIVRPANSNDVVATYGLQQPVPLTVAASAVFEIEDRIVTDHPVDRVSIRDPLPAGFQAVDASFQTSSSYYQARSDNWQIDYQQIYFDRIEAFARHLDAGVYGVHYIVRSVTPGTYTWPAATASLLFAPEEFGRTANSSLIVK